jgi:acyl carrier protein
MITEEFKTLFNAIIPEFDTDLLTAESSMGRPEEWDSIANLNLLLAIEETYSVRFSMEEMAVLDNIEKIGERLLEDGVKIVDTELSVS